MFRLRDEHCNQHLQISRSSLITEEQTNRLIHLSGEAASQVCHDDTRDDQSVQVHPLLGRKDLPDGHHDLRPGVSSSGVWPLPSLLVSHMLEHVSHSNEVGAERTCLETSAAGSARDDVPSDEFESSGCRSHQLGTLKGDAVVEGLDGSEGSAVCEGSSDDGSAGEATGSESASGLLTASCVRCQGGVALLDGEQGPAAHGAGGGSGLLEPFGDARLAEDVAAWQQLDGRIHLCHADGACIGRVLHWYQTSGKEVGASRERHVVLLSLVRMWICLSGSSFTCIRACRNESV